MIYATSLSFISCCLFARLSFYLLLSPSVYLVYIYSSTNSVLFPTVDIIYSVLLDRTMSCMRCFTGALAVLMCLLCALVLLFLLS